MGLPMPRSITSAPARRLSAFNALSHANRYGGKRRSRVDTSMVKGSEDPPAMIFLSGKWDTLVVQPLGFRLTLARQAKTQTTSDQDTTNSAVRVSTIQSK